MVEVWTLAALKEHFDRRLADMEVLAAARDAHIHEVLDDLHRDISRVANTAPSMLSRADYEPRHQQLEDRIGVVSAAVAAMEGARRGALDSRTLVFALVAAIVTVGGFLVGFARL